MAGWTNDSLLQVAGRFAIHSAWTGLLWLALSILIHDLLMREEDLRSRERLGWLGLGLAPLVTLGAWVFLPASAPSPPPSSEGVAGAGTALVAVAGLLSLSGSALLALRLALGAFALARIAKNSIPAGPGDRAVLESLATRMGYSGGVELGFGGTATAMTWGNRPATILLPAVLAGTAGATATGALLLHELAHVVRRDATRTLLRRASEVVSIANPAVHWLSRRLEEYGELSCDESAATHLGSRSRYASALALLAHTRLPRLRLAATAGGSTLLGRVRRLAGLPVDPGRRAPRRRVLTLALALAAAAAIPGAASLPPLPGASRAHPADSSGSSGEAGEGPGESFEVVGELDSGAGIPHPPAPP